MPTLCCTNQSCSHRDERYPFLKRHIEEGEGVINCDYCGAPMSEPVWQVYIISGDGNHTLDVDWPYCSLDECTGVVKRFDERFQEWEKRGYELLDDDPLKYYEGCDVYAKNKTTGETYWFNEKDQWEED